MLVVLGLWAFFPALEGGFLIWDDPVMVTKNPVIQSLSWENVRVMFTTYRMNIYTPLSLLTYALEYHAFGPDPFVFHATNLALHLANGLLVLLLTRALTGSLPGAWLTALLFTLHPLQVETVAWINERRNLLQVFFFLGAWLAWLRYREEGSRGWWWTTASLMVLSGLAKGVAFTLPLVLLLQEWRDRDPERPPTLTDKLPLFAIAAALLVVGGQAVQTGVRGDPLWDRIQVASYGALFYVGKLAWPTGLAAIYPYPEKIAGVFPLAFRAAPWLLAGLLIAILASARRTREIVFLSGFYLLNVAPSLQFIPVGLEVAAGDHFAYLPSLAFHLGFSQLVIRWWEGGGWGTAALPEGESGPSPRPASDSATGEPGTPLQGEPRQTPGPVRVSGACRPWTRLALLVGLVLGLAACITITREQCGFWQDSVSLFREAVRVHPRSPAAHHLLGWALQQRGEFAAAESSFDAMIAVDPTLAQGWIGRGCARSQLDRSDEAEADLLEGVRRAPENPTAWGYLASLRLQTGRPGLAVMDAGRALALAPTNPDHAYALAYAQFRAGSWHEARNAADRALALAPRRWDILQLRAVLAFHLGEFRRLGETLQRWWEAAPESLGPAVALAVARACASPGEFWPRLLPALAAAFLGLSG